MWESGYPVGAIFTGVLKDLHNTALAEGSSRAGPAIKRIQITLRNNKRERMTNSSPISGGATCNGRVYFHRSADLAMAVAREDARDRYRDTSITSTLVSGRNNRAHASQAYTSTVAEAVRSVRAAAAGSCPVTPDSAGLYSGTNSARWTRISCDERRLTTLLI